MGNEMNKKNQGQQQGNLGQKQPMDRDRQGSLNNPQKPQDRTQQDKNKIGGQHQQGVNKTQQQGFNKNQNQKPWNEKNK